MNDTALAGLVTTVVVLVLLAADKVAIDGPDHIAAAVRRLTERWTR